MTAIFSKEPLLVINAYNDGINFHEIMKAIRGVSPEMALAGIEFWNKFIMLETIDFNEDFRMDLFR